ncbi:MAG: GAF domain-containing protein, partial [Gammaproteobacteria bacterium]|nr:GAF domain-containing protein [Gammaproteobacteria bacterium]
MLQDFRVRQRDFLLEISRAITAQLELSEVLRRVLNASVVMLGGQLGLVALRDPGGEYRIRATLGIETDQVPDLNDQLNKLLADDALDYDSFTDQLTRIAIGLDRRMRQSFALPLVFADQPLGLLIVFRAQRGMATADDIQVLQSFADQAAIAIQNAGLLAELKERTAALTEALEQQTATSEVLGVISRSKFEIQPVLDTIVRTAGRLCQAEMALIYRIDADAFRVVAHYGDDSALDYLLQHPLRPGTGTVTGRVLLEGRTVHVPDVLADPSYTWREGQQSVRHRTILGVPLLREGRILGTISVTRSWVGPFTDKQIELITTFADQAVIAIENVRLFEEVQARTRELTESLDRQTATGEVLGAISRSKFDVQPVMEMIVATAARLCQAEMADIARFDGTTYQTVAMHGYDQASRDYLLANPVEQNNGSLQGRVLATRRTEHIADCLADPDYKWREGQGVLGQRSMLGVPLLRGDEFMGAITLMRRSVRPFTEKQIELVTTFADQAVIAIENARLLARARELDIAQERERIARDLHDTVIQRLFATGLSLQSAARLADQPEVVDRIQQAVDELDLTVRDVRSSIFELNPPPTSS